MIEIIVDTVQLVGWRRALLGGGEGGWGALFREKGGGSGHFSQIFSLRLRTKLC